MDTCTYEITNYKNHADLMVCYILQNNDTEQTNKL